MTELRHPDEHRPAELTVDDFCLLAEAGAFDRYSKSELIDGEILVVNAQFVPHALVKTQLAVRIQLALNELGSDLKAVVEASVPMPPNNQPEPDISLMRLRGDERWGNAHDTVLVIEVADSTLAFDMKRKRVVYARAAIPEYWVVDIRGKRIVQFAGPEGEGFATERSTAFGERIEAVTIEGLGVDTGGLI